VEIAIAYDGAGYSDSIAHAVSRGTPGYSGAGSGFFAHIVDNQRETLIVRATVASYPVASDLMFCGIRVRYWSPGTFDPGMLGPAVLPPPDSVASDNSEQNRNFEE